jgi:acetyl esterase
VSAAVPIDPTAAAVIEILEAVFPRIDNLDADAATVRAKAKEMPSVSEVEEVASVEDQTIPGPDRNTLPIRAYRPSRVSGDPAPGVVYFHGGGWVICDLDTHDGACRRLANEIGAVVVSVDYRLAPEHRYPAAVDDAYAATVWVADHAADLGIDPERLVVAGDSAGGNLTAAVALMARDRAGPPLAFQLLVYPVIDSSATRLDHPSKTDNATGYFLTTLQMEWYRKQYVATDAHGEEAYCSPNRAPSLAGLPPACIVTAEMDPLRDEAEHYARRLVDAGVPVTYYRAPGMFHGFFNMDAALEGAKEAQGIAFTAMREALGVDSEASARGAGTLRRSEPGQEPSLATATENDDGRREAPGPQGQERD